MSTTTGVSRYAYEGADGNPRHRQAHRQRAGGGGHSLQRLPRHLQLARRGSLLHLLQVDDVLVPIHAGVKRRKQVIVYHSETKMPSYHRRNALFGRVKASNMSGDMAMSSCQSVKAVRQGKSPCLDLRPLSPVEKRLTSVWKPPIYVICYLGAARYIMENL